MNKKTMAVLLAFAMMSAFLTSCASSSSSTSTPSQPPALPSESVQNASSQTTEIAALFSDRDLEGTYDPAKAIEIALTNESASCTDASVSISRGVITLTKAGTYLLSGTLTEGQIIVDAPKTDKLQIVLNNAVIRCQSSAPLYVKQADQVFVTLADGSQNHLETTGEFIAIDENSVDAALFSKEDLTLNGSGELTITAPYGHGVLSKDDLVVTGGTYLVTAAQHGLSGKDCINIADGSLTITAGTDGLHSENKEDTTLGSIYIANGTFNLTTASDGIDAAGTLTLDGGSFTIAAEDDGLHSNSALTINNGTINVTKSYEGLEGKSVDIHGGFISILSSDDGINAAGESNDSEQKAVVDELDRLSIDAGIYIRITGGTVIVDAQGDGIDSNADLTVTGGEVYVTGPTGSGNTALDYDGEGVISGGTLIAVGPAGMLQGFSSSSTQGTIVYSFTTDQSGAIALTDSTGKTLAAFTPTRAYRSVVLSAPALLVGQSYTLTTGTESQTIALETLQYSNGGDAGGRGQGQGRPAMGGTPPEGLEGQPPRGNRPSPDGGASSRPERNSQSTSVA